MTEFVALHEISQILESAQGSEERLVHVLEVLQRIVPYERCALLEALPGREPRLLVLPETPPEARMTLLETLTRLHSRLVDERAHPLPRTRQWVGHLAVPLVGNDEVVGVLYVRGAAPEGGVAEYTERHLRGLSIVGAQLAAYLRMREQVRAFDEARAQADAANRMKDEFLALVSHNLKTPLTSMLAWTHLLRSEETGPTESLRAVEAIERNVRALAKLVDEVLELACVATADLRLDLEAVEPATLIRAAVEEHRLRAERRSIRLDTSIDDSVAELVVDPARVVQIISSLVANAIQVTANGGDVGIRLERAGTHARIQVIDHGKGIAPDVLPHVFEKLSPGQSPSLNTFAGPGLGLAIVKTLVVAHGGRVGVESPGPDKGATFTVDLPLPGEGLEQDQRVLAGIRVLLVDDDDDMRFATSSLLGHYGAEVTSVGSVGAALDALERQKPHVLLSDISMRGESGCDLMRQVAARDPSIPGAAVTSFVGEADRKRAVEAGFRMHVAKPFDALTLVAAVATLSGRSLANRSRDRAPQPAR